MLSERSGVLSVFTIVTPFPEILTSGTLGIQPPNTPLAEPSTQFEAGPFKLNPTNVPSLALAVASITLVRPELFPASAP